MLPEILPARLLFVTAGSGITPVMSMLRSFALAGDMPDVFHAHVAPTGREVIFGDELRRLAARFPSLRLHEHHTRPVPGRRTRRPTVADLSAACTDVADRMAWVCGPRGLLDGAEAYWRAAGLADRLRTERFQSVRRPSGAPGGRVRFVRSDREVAADEGTSLLAVGEEADVVMPSGCRMGVCRTCLARLADGRVRDLRTGEEHGDPGDLIQTCVSTAVGDVDLDLQPGHRPATWRRTRMSGSTHLSARDIEEFGRELDRLRAEVIASRGEDDARYIRRVIAVQRRLEAGGRAVMFASVVPPAWLAGTTMLSVAKILENMEIEHNVLHGQWDWMRDPDIHSTTWEWDFASPADQWKHSHNYAHHTYTNVLGKDRDLGYGMLRVSPE